MHGLAGKEFVPPSSFLSELVPMAPMTRASPVNPLHKASVMVNKAVSAGLIADGLTHSILDFVQEHSDSVVREDRWKTCSRQSRTGLPNLEAEAPDPRSDQDHDAPGLRKGG
jgi:hypothetical protein